MAKVKTIDEYIGSFEKEIQQKLEELRKTIRTAAPEANEELKWSRPAYTDEKRILVMFGGFKHHIGFYVTPTSIEAFEDELAGFETGKGSVQFPYDLQLPTDLIRNITEYRVWESREKGIKWKS